MQRTVFTGGTVIVGVTQDGTAKISNALAIENGKVAALGDAALAYIEQAAKNSEDQKDVVEVVDLAGGVLAPAIGDGHAHPVFGALEYTGPQIREAEDLDGILEAIKKWVAENPDAEWIRGASFDATFVPGGQFDAAWLDEVTGDKPAVMRSWDYHTVWVNSAALAAGGITADTPDPELGRIVRREDGSPQGTLQEAAANNFLAEVVPPYTTTEKAAAIERATKEYSEIGVTWIQDAWVEPADVAAYIAAANAKQLHARVNLALRADPKTWRDQVAEFVKLRQQVNECAATNYGTEGEGKSRLTANTIKFFMDGVVEGHTAALSQPYTDRPHECGIPNWQGQELIDAVTAFSAAGFQLHLHAIGDAANTAALDALEHIRNEGISDLNHVIAHVSMLKPEDVKRFKEIGVIANFEPYWAQCDAFMTDLTLPFIGHDREQWSYLIGSVQRAGGTVSFGSDWPVTTKDWRLALATAITRQNDLTPEGEPWLPAERISAPSALAAYTSGIAAQALATDRGTLEVGQTADAVWLDTDPLQIAATDIPNIQVRGTWLAGDRTF